MSLQRETGVMHHRAGHLNLRHYTRAASASQFPDQAAFPLQACVTVQYRPKTFNRNSF